MRKDLHKKRKASEFSRKLLVVEVTGFEPATFWSRTHPRTLQPLEERLNSTKIIMHGRGIRKRVLWPQLRVCIIPEMEDRVFFHT